LDFSAFIANYAGFGVFDSLGLPIAWSFLGTWRPDLPTGKGSQ
jgi:hypothetical protein